MLYPGCLPLLVILVFLILLPLFFAQFMLAALSKLGLDPQIAFLALAGIIIGGSINIPIKRIPRDEDYSVDPLRLFGFGDFFPRLRVTRRYTTIAVNVGGCVIPCMIALYQFARIVAHGAGAVMALLLITALSILVCYRLARPMEGIGIALPALIPPLVAAIPSMLLVPDFAPPIAFVAGVLGPLIGADLLHIAEIKYVRTGSASIGGAGTFDGIVLSGLIAALLA